MANQLLLERLKKLSASLKKEAQQAERKSEEALFAHKPYAQWTQLEKDRFFAGSTEQRLKDSDRWMDKEIDLKSAAQELDALIFMHSRS